MREASIGSVKRQGRPMSTHIAPACGICGSGSDYCHMTTATGIQIDCRDLQLKNTANLAWNIEFAREMHRVNPDAKETVSVSDEAEVTP
jgi:hypothetical protein